jgi:deazaflavin-dependent oxidoreductase (nitroreductase family)
MEFLMSKSVRRVVFTFVALGVAILAIRAAASDKLVRQFNKHVLNPFALWVVARRPMYYGVIHHVGRHSGRTYSTPLVAKLTADSIIIPLPYGPGTDWCRNLLAAGHATLTLHGAEYAVENPTIVDVDVAGPLVPAATARVWRWMRIQKYLRVNVHYFERADLAPAA